MSEADAVAQEEKTGLSRKKIERLISDEATQGLEYVYGTDLVAAQRDRNWDYYNGVMRDLPSAVGRSRFVDRSMKSYIGMMLPSLMRVFTAGKTIADYAPPSEQYAPICKQLTRYINDTVFKKDNRGEALLRDWATDALIQKVGIVKGWWNEEYLSVDETIGGIPDENTLALVVSQAMQAGQEVIAYDAQEAAAVDQMGTYIQRTFSLTLRRKVNKSTVKLDTVPPEEFIISRDARTLEEAVLVCHRCAMTVGQLVEMGFDPVEVDNLPSYSDPYPDRMAKYNEPTGYSYGALNRDSSADPSLRKVSIFQGILRCDADGEGVKEWFITAGGEITSIKLLEIEPYKCQVWFADFCPDPLPHTFYGLCPADDLAEIQKINTVLTRQMADNLYLSNTPQREVVQDWIIKPDQLMNMAPGAPVLVKQPGAIREISVPFIAGHALTAIEFFNGQAEMRTGASRQSAGLDPEALSNQSATAANISYTSSLGRIEMIARTWAQGGMRKLFRGILKCLTEYQDYERIVVMDGGQVAINPQQWKTLGDIDITINTGLGTGNRDRDAMALGGIIAQQKEIIGQLGPNNPIVTPQKMVRALQMQAEAAGVENPELFFGDAVNPDGSPFMPQPQAPQPTPDTMVFAQVEAQKLQQKQAEAMAQIQSDQAIEAAKIAADKQIQLTKIAVDRELELLRLQGDQQKIQVEAAKAALDADAKQAALVAKNKEGDKPSVVIRSDAKDGIEAALSEMKGMSETMAQAADSIGQAAKAMNKKRRLIKDDNGRAVGSEVYD
jgi:hypothetical protein